MEITAVETIHPARSSPPFVVAQFRTDEALSRPVATLWRSSAP